MSTFDRRDFLRLAALTAADFTLLGMVTGCTSTATIPAPVATPYATSNSVKGRAVMCLAPHRPGLSLLRVMNWDELSYEDLEIPIGMVHSITIDRNDPNVLFAFEFFGSALRIDLLQKKFVKIDHRDEKSLFSGHGSITTSGEYVMSTHLTPGASCDMALRDAKTFRKIALAPRECGNSHHVVNVPGTNLVAIGNLRGLGGETTGAVTFYDTNERRVTNRVDFPIPINHLAALSPTTVVGVSRATSFKMERRGELNVDNGAAENLQAFADSSTPIPSPLFVANVDGSKKDITTAKDLSLMLDNFGVAKVTETGFLSAHEGSGKVILWESFAKKHVFDFEKPTNLLTSRDGSEFLVVSNRRLKIVSLKTLKTVREFPDWPPVASIAAYAMA